MSRGRTKPLEPLKPAQAAAVDPEVHAWVAASAGTGKTQVLSARVLRLLLAPSPDRPAVQTHTQGQTQVQGTDALCLHVLKRRGPPLLQPLLLQPSLLLPLPLHPLL